MTVFAIFLVSLSALAHASWNLLCKSKVPSGAFFVLSTATSVLCMIPLYWYFFPVIQRLPRTFWVLLLITGLLQCIYYITLGNAYRLTDISVAYPLARALPVLMTPVVTMAGDLGTPLPSGALFAFLLIFLGCISLPQKRFPDIFTVRRYRNKGFLFVFAAAVCITGYTVVDKEAVNLLKNGTFCTNALTIALLYISLEDLMILVFLTPYVLGTKTEHGNLRILIRDYLKYPLMAGVICSTGYLLVLWAMTQASNVSYVVAFRQLSIPLGAVLGMLLLKERSTKPKLAGLVLIVSGLLLLTFFS